MAMVFADTQQEPAMLGHRFNFLMVRRVDPKALGQRDESDRCWLIKFTRIFGSASCSITLSY